MRLCMCGCGRMVPVDAPCRCGCRHIVSNKFVPGHSGRLMSTLCTAVRTETVLEVNDLRFGDRDALVGYAYAVSEAFGQRFEQILKEGSAYQ